MEFGFNPYLAFAGSLLAGLIMSMGGGGGSILVGVANMSLLGIGDANLIKAVNQILELASRALSVPLYHRQKRLVWPLAIVFSIGAPFGAVAGAWFSVAYLSDMSVYRPVFGALVAAVAARVLYEARLKPANRGHSARKAHAVTERLHLDRSRPHAQADNPGPILDSPTTDSIGWREIRVRFAGEFFAFNPFLAAGGAFAISFVGAVIGVGGGFMVTPFMASVLFFPMYLVVGTSLVVLVVPLVVAFISYLALQVQMDWWLVAIEVPGVMVGSVLGPMLNRYMNEKLLKIYVAVVLFAIGVYYLF
jgi:hypothetical protein